MLHAARLNDSCGNGLQVEGHFKEFAQKFSLLPPSENKDINISVAWWGKSIAAYHCAALNGFWNIPSHLKMDPGYFGRGFYLTRYPRYSDYYLNGLSMDKHTIEKGDILMCYTALGRPYYVTQDPSNSDLPLMGQPCGPDSPCDNRGRNAHDSHYITVKLHPESGQYLPCPVRQVPDFDEIVLFNANRILPTANVSFRRRRKTLLWLACSDDLVQVHSILSQMKTVEVKRGNTAGRKILVTNARAKLEDQVDLALFVSVPDFAEFMQSNLHLKDYPSSLFRIVCSHEQYKLPGSVQYFLHSHPTWAANAPELLVFCKQELSLPKYCERNVRVTADAGECLEFASFME
jgi:hypothetical protein